jgi:hypothetical protein
MDFLTRRRDVASIRRPPEMIAMTRRLLTPLLLAVATLVLWVAPAAAARARYHFVPAGEGPNLIYQPDANGTGERLTWFGGVRPGCDRPPPRPTVFATFRHPMTGCCVSVPLALPEGTPVIMHRYDTVIYNYGSYAVEVRFLPDGSIDVIYNSGLLRAL